MKRLFYIIIGLTCTWLPMKGQETLSLDFIVDENENVYSMKARNLSITRDSLSYITLSGTVSCNGKSYAPAANYRC